MSATATTEKKYLKWYQKLAYGSGDLASNCSYGLVSSFVLLYLTGTLGLDSAIIGSLMLASKVLDGISDVIFGTLIDRTHSQAGQGTSVDAVWSGRCFPLPVFAVCHPGW